MPTTLTCEPTRRRCTSLVGAVLAALLLYQWQTSPEPSLLPRFAGTPKAAAAMPSAIVLQSDGAGIFNRRAFASLLAADPLAALKRAREFHRRTVQDYRCTFVKQELLYSGMSDEQVIAVKFREKPYSVEMNWLRNPGKATRVIYVAGQWTDADAARPEDRELAVCQPGAIARMFVKSVKQPIHGPRAKDASRRYIDDFGFAKALDLMIQFSGLAASRGELKLVYAGQSEFDGRPTWVLHRWVPYNGPTGRYPDAAAVYHIDQDWLIPVAIYSYADPDRHELLGRYEYRDVKLNVGCTNSDFAPATYGM